MPTTSGGPLRAATIWRPSPSLETTAIPYTPSTSSSARRTAPSRSPLVIGFDQVRQDLRVGFGGENMAFGHQAVLEIEIVLNNAIMCNVESSRTIVVRVGIGFARPSVRGPTRVADSAFDGAVGGIGLPVLFLQRFNPADRTDDLGLPFVDNGDTTGIVAPVFEPFQAID